MHPYRTVHQTKTKHVGYTLFTDHGMVDEIGEGVHGLVETHFRTRQTLDSSLHLRLQCLRVRHLLR